MTLDLAKLRVLAAAWTEGQTRESAINETVMAFGVLDLIDEVELLRATSLTPDEASLCDWGLGVLTSDYNEAPHDNIGALRERLKRERV